MSLTTTTSALSKGIASSAWSMVEYALYFLQCIGYLVGAIYQSSLVQQIFALHDYLFYLEVFNVTKNSGSTTKKSNIAPIQSENYSLKCINEPQVDKVEIDAASEPHSKAPPGLGHDMVFDDASSAFSNEQECLRLHSDICSRAFSKNVDSVLTEVVDIVSNKMFLNIDHIVKGGSVRKDTAIADITDIEVAFFIQNLPREGHDKWLPPMLNAVATALDTHLDKEMAGIEAIELTKDSVQLRVKGIIIIDLLFSPVFDSYRSVISALSRLAPTVQQYFRATTIKRRNQFIAKQPEHVKMTIRLLKWWRNQQMWSSELTRPSDEILESIAVHSARTWTTFTQRKAMANIMSCLAGFDQLRIVSSDYYSENDIWQPLLVQRPLLMDPSNPYVNIANPYIFDPSEIMAFARATL